MDLMNDQINPIGNRPGKKQKQPRILESPDFKYKGLLYSDGITDKNIKILPATNDTSQNASNMFKQCIFKIEIQQDCEVNIRLNILNEKKDSLENQLKQLIFESNGETNAD